MALGQSGRSCFGGSWLRELGGLAGCFSGALLMLVTTCGDYLWWFDFFAVKTNREEKPGLQVLQLPEIQKVVRQMLEEAMPRIVAHHEVFACFVFRAVLAFLQGFLETDKQTTDLQAFRLDHSSNRRNWEGQGGYF